VGALAFAKDAIVASRYRLIGVVGEGAAGVVWEAEHTLTKKHVALKILKAGATEEARRRWQREVKAAAAVRHPNVVDIQDFIKQEDALVIVMELLKGETLGAVLKREAGGKIPLEKLASILVPAISAVGSAHALGIIHRDLKPENIFLMEDGSVKVLDFGVAKLTASEGLAAQTIEAALTNTGSILGTPYYMSPEQVFAEKDIDARADVWSFGIILYECLSGVRPTEDTSVGRVLRRIMNADFAPLTGVDADIADLVMRMLSADREKRPTDLHEVSETLELFTKVRAPAFDTPPPPSVRAATGSSAVEIVIDPSAATIPSRVPGEPRADTNGAVALRARRKKSRKNQLGLAGIAAVALILALVVWRLQSTSSTTAPAAALIVQDSAPTIVATASSAVAVEAASVSPIVVPPTTTTPSPPRVGLAVAVKASPAVIDAGAPPQAPIASAKPKPPDNGIVDVPPF